MQLTERQRELVNEALNIYHELLVEDDDPGNLAIARELDEIEI